MSGSASENWLYLGASNVGEGEEEENNRIPMPDGVFEAGILPYPEEVDREVLVHWAFEDVVGFLIFSDRPLMKDSYRSQGSVKLGGPKDKYRATIPIEFFKEEGLEAFPEKARVRYGETRYFLAREQMTEGETKSCYLLTREQLENTISTPDEWAGSFDSIPRFMRGP